MSQLVFDTILSIAAIVLLVLISYVFFRVARWIVDHIGHGRK
jgi:small neutral amino acid transporter SnatA (MarC family)